MGTVLGSVPFTGRVVGTSRGNGGMPAETFSGVITAQGGVDSPGDVAISGALLAKGGVTLHDGGNGVKVRGETPCVKFAGDDGTLNGSAEIGNFIPFTAPAPLTVALPTGAVETFEDPDTGSTYMAPAMSNQSGDAYFFLETDADGAWPSVPSGVSLAPKSAVSLSTWNNNVTIQADDIGKEDEPVKVGELPWTLSTSSIVASGNADVVGVIPGRIVFKASKLYWKDREIYVDENGVLKLRD